MGNDKKRVELFEVSEDEVARRLGVPREMVREWRTENLYEGEDFGLVNREIRYAASGLGKLREVLKKTLPAGALAGDMELGKGGARGAAGAPSDATVVRVYGGNPKYMQAEIGGELVTVRVRDNRNFLPGMRLEGRHLMLASGALYDFVGRCPRARGRW